MSFANLASEAKLGRGVWGETRQISQSSAASADDGEVGKLGFSYGFSYIFVYRACIRLKMAEESSR